MRGGLKGLNTQQIMSKISRANEQNRPYLEELQQRKIGMLLEHNRLQWWVTPTFQPVKHITDVEMHFWGHKLVSQMTSSKG